MDHSLDSIPDTVTAGGGVFEVLIEFVPGYGHKYELLNEHGYSVTVEFDIADEQLTAYETDDESTAVDCAVWNFETLKDAFSWAIEVVGQ